MGVLYANETIFPGFDIALSNVVLTFHGSCEIRKTNATTYTIIGYWDLYSKAAYDFNNTPDLQEAVKPPLIRSIQKATNITQEQLNSNPIDVLYTVIMSDITGGAIY